ncbi:MAG TPA: 2-amino-4-hydroxy-6-hydroxymethyldihydropteridine diphosphokinase [Hyphomicrobiaceae bacterium]|nr:2-amino-4-hydroxy-6-hydroxymethyldihydropteridine diphosphokinase [Hyphomicrobiaceae bacterium]
MLAFGANISGAVGSPEQTLSWTIVQLSRAGMDVIDISEPVTTRAVGGKTRLPYLNAAVLVACDRSPADLLRTLKRLERQAGRRTLARNASRPLDLDILLWRGGRVGFSRHGRRFGSVQIPHPELYRRAFMMVPLTSLVPFWWHAGFREPGRRLVRRLVIRPGDIAPGGGRSRGEACVRPSSVAKGD